LTSLQKRFTGERFDGETGLVFLNGRYLDPGKGGFLSPTGSTRPNPASAPTDTPMRTTIRSTSPIRTGTSGAPSQAPIPAAARSAAVPIPVE
jgi:hypothetical protein